MADFTVTFRPGNRSVVVREHVTALEAATAAGIPLQTPCGGQGRCGKCLVRVGGALEGPTAVEQRVLTEEQLAEGWRLACQARIGGDAEVTVPESSLLAEHRIMVEGAEREIEVRPNVAKTALQLPHPSAEDPQADLTRVLDALGGKVRPPGRLAPLQSLPAVLRDSQFHVTAVAADGVLLAVEPGDTSENTYGLAVDVGTTTVVAYLCHLPSGKCVTIASDLNSQAQYGDDIISRIQVANSAGDGLAALSRAVVTVINGLVERTCREAGISEDAIYELTVVGNTCMGHLFLGVPPAGLGCLPFVQAFRSGRIVRAADLDIRVHPEALVYLVPNIGGFVGADTVGVILAGELDRSDCLRVAVDIGTNGEIVVARDGALHAASTAAGPAFEGARISQGMRAALGAIDRVQINDDVICHVIGEVAPRGLCGSGLVDAVAEVVRLGIVTETGRMLSRQEVSGLPEKVAGRLVGNGADVRFVLAWPDEASGGEGIALTGRDVRETQLAKAALYGGMELLLEELDARPDDIEELLLAGAFGNYIGRESAVGIGLIPALPADRIRSIGNAAGVGARLVLCSTEERRRAEEIARRVQHVDLSERKGFYDRFADAMMLRPLP
jgi:uncharacterized 2Fe-2S/4Fe-4S cluster protein (DUF4445 family)